MQTNYTSPQTPGRLPAGQAVWPEFDDLVVAEFPKYQLLCLRPLSVLLLPFFRLLSPYSQYWKVTFSVGSS